MIVEKDKIKKRGLVLSEGGRKEEERKWKRRWKLGDRAKKEEEKGLKGDAS